MANTPVVITVNIDGLIRTNILEVRPVPPPPPPTPPTMVNLLVNGSFEEPDTSGSSMGWLTYGPDSRPNHPAVAPSIPGWTIIRGTIDVKSRYWQATDGRQSIDLVGDSPAT